MDNVFEIEFTKEELNILRIALTPHESTSFAIACDARNKGGDVAGALQLSRSLFSRISTILDNINTQ